VLRVWSKGLKPLFLCLPRVFSVLSYEYAAKSFDSKAMQAYSGTVMNTTFQVSTISRACLDWTRAKLRAMPTCRCDTSCHEE
jgi:hypothetical protein